MRVAKAFVHQIIEYDITRVYLVIRAAQLWIRKQCAEDRALKRGLLSIERQHVIRARNQAASLQRPCSRLRGLSFGGGEIKWEVRRMKSLLPRP